jgi:prevent-host-death family protein
MAAAGASPGREPLDREDDDRVYVGIRELRHDFRAFLERVRAGERLVVTDRGIPIADINPYVRERTIEEILVEDFGATLGTGELEPLWSDDDPISTDLSDELARMRDEERML